MQRFMHSLPGPQEIFKTVSGALGLLSLQNYTSQQLLEDTNFLACPLPQLSCETQFNNQDTCCFNHPGGHLLLTQFWDAEPAVGPDDAWTIHGLWPDHCDGNYDQSCDQERECYSISQILANADRSDLLNYMSIYWKDNRGNDPDLWAHEWNKHGTCISTLRTRCYVNYTSQQEVVDYFNKTVEIFQKLPSFEFLSRAGIVPSYEVTYSLDDILSALGAAHGADVTVRCQNWSLNEIWYHFHVSGRLQNGRFVPADPEPTRKPSVSRVHLSVFTLNQKRGCIISRGTWFVSGTCATFKAKLVSDGVTLESRRGPCAFKNDILTCGSRIRSPAIFKVVDGKLMFDGKTTFFADKAPKGRGQSKVFLSGGDDHPIELQIGWQNA
ncbi:hypothetical protein Egran_04264 [Elaphomyces granulatus]|uniref:Ribonuclease T2-like n=1 Tax=Elaphomyces granulatus TaxID=519963 RepID=A0A232LV23_9EURO|nr:hypothetical protein Egran_04264 [Elaphomyces granulatus]